MIASCGTGLTLYVAVEFITYLQYCRNLKFEDRPEYADLRKLFRDALIREVGSQDVVFDWSDRSTTGCFFR